MRFSLVLFTFAILCVSGLQLFAQPSAEPAPAAQTQDGQQSDSDDTAQSEADVTIALTASGYEFFLDGQSNPELSVQEGQRVRIELTVEGGTHDWVLPEFDAATSVVGRGTTTIVEFTADEAGSFAYYCSVGNHRARGMEGSFVVTAVED